MSFNTTVTPKGKPSRPADIILASDIANGLAYADRHGHGTNTIIVTPRSIARLRGRIGAVYATRKARTHPRYADMLTVARACGATLPRKAKDRRVA